MFAYINFPKCFLSFFCYLSISTIAFGQSQKTEQDLLAIMAKYQTVGMSVAVVKNNKIIYTKSLGLKDIAEHTPLANEDIFRIASISKSFTATSLMQLIEAGKFSLDDEFSELIGFKINNPKFPNTKITLRMILSHTSSLSDKNGYFDLDVINPNKNPNWAASYNDYEPGKGYEYCNLNFNLAGTLLEKASGERFDQYVKHHLLDPLGLYGGYCVDSLDNKRFVTLYTYNNEKNIFEPSPEAYAPKSEQISHYIMGYSTPVFSPTGGMKISATDLAKYMMMHMNYGTSNRIKIISKKSAQTMQTKLSDDEGYGLALRQITDLIPGKTLIGHNGDAYGLYSSMFFQPKEKFGIVVITNGCKTSYTNDFNDFLKESIRSLYDNLIAN
ncbi:hypothetical protein GCM10023231_14590 [Olivibacter ginsenosidimutans]|uniref:Beta-lactamase-related domain-containing protein n=1 Tax=Olivibacter ginsenosidimutans TaxID=1176537 RepID=A0ABP9B1A1_9SPHI